MSLLIVYVMIAVVTSFACSIMEATLLSVSNSYIKKLIKDNSKVGSIIWKLKIDIDRPLAAILTLNTIANTFGATAAGAQAQKVFSSQYIGVFVAVFTLSILIFSEIIPKTIGAVYWRKTLGFTAYTLKIIVVVLAPFIYMCRVITKIFSPKNKVNPKIFREEISMLAEMGEDMGIITGSEEKVIRNMLALSKIKVKDIMTPRTVMMSLDETLKVKDVFKRYPNILFARIPVYEKTPDNMKGMVLRHDLLASAAKDQHNKPIQKLLRPLHHVPQSLSVADAINKFIKRQEQMFLVIDEYGGTFGIVTLEDCLEALLGSEIIDEKDAVPDMRELALRIWKYKKKKNQVKENS